MAGILKLLKGFNWLRIGMIAGIAVSIFGLGYMYANQKHAEHEADVQKQITAAIVAKEAELRAAFSARLAVEDEARRALAFDLSQIQEQRDALLAALNDAELTKPIADINCEGILETDDENVRIVLANPFTADFVRLWNDASRGRLPGTDTDAETR